MAVRSIFAVWIDAYKLLLRRWGLLTVMALLMSYGFTIGWAMIKGAYVDLNDLSTQILALNIPGQFLWGLLIVLVESLWWLIVLPAMLWTTLQIAQAKPVSLRLAFQSITWRRLMDSFSIVNWLSLMIAGGTLLMVLPGIWLGLCFCLSLQVYMAEGVYGLAALQRSKDLVMGHFIRTAGLLLLVAGSHWAMGFVIKQTYHHFIVHPLGLTLLEGLASALTAPVLYLAMALWYCELVKVKAPPKPNSIDDKFSAVDQQGVSV